MLHSLFSQVKKRANVGGHNNNNRMQVPDNLFFKCPKCKKVYTSDAFLRNSKVCPHCNYHTRIKAKERLAITVDKNSFVEYDTNMQSKNPIDFPGYEEKVKFLQKQTGLKDAVVTGKCTIKGYPCVIGAMDTRFMMASMGSVVGEKITRAFEKATEENLPVIIFAASGGARMQEGIVSLMQMAKTSAAVAKHSENGGLFVSVLTDPTTGGVTASFASLGDIIVCEPTVLVGFAGKRVIEGTIKQKLPPDFQSAEFLFDHGFADMIVSRKEMRKTLGTILKLHYVKNDEEKRGEDNE